MAHLDALTIFELGSSRKLSRGFTIMELLIAVAIVAILASIAIPSYTNSIAKTKRRAAETCLASFATQLERYYTTNLRYCVDGDGDGACDSTTFPLPTLDCASAANTGRDYDYSATVAASTFTVSAVPKGSQNARDSRCGTLSINQAGTRNASGADGTVACW